MKTPLPASTAAHAAATSRPEAPPQDVREFLASTLRLEGCECSFDDDRDIMFRHDGFTYCLCLWDDDPEFLQLVLPNFHTVSDMRELPSCLMVADRINRSFKGAKLVTASSEKGVGMHAAAEFMVADARQVAPVLLRAAGCLASAVRDFRTVLRVL